MRISIEVTGTTPLIIHSFTDAEALQASGGSSSASSAADRGSPREAAEKSLYKGINGDLILPQPNLLRCLVDGGAFHKAGRAQITTAKKSVLYSCLDIEGAEIPIISSEGWCVDTRAVRIPATGGRILRHRPIFNDWKLQFVAELDTSIVSARLLRMIVDDAGRRIGIGDFRPSCKGPYGKFLVTRWEEVSEEEMLRAAE